MPTPSESDRSTSRSALVFDGTNYLLLFLSFLLIVIGFVAMYLDGQFLGFVALNVSPIVILSGYALLIYAILRRSDDEAASDEASA